MKTLLHLLLIPPLACMFAMSVGAESVRDADPRPESPDHTKPAQTAPAHMASVDRGIRLFQTRVDRNPREPKSLLILGRLYLRRAQEQDDHADYALAEAAFRRAHQLDPASKAAKPLLAAALHAQHRFTEALAAADETLARDPTNTLALALRGDAHLELGNYCQAETVYAQLTQTAPDTPSLAARRARLRELQGKPQVALADLKNACQAVRDAGLPPIRIAWYERRIAGLHFAQAQLEPSARHYQEALALVEDDALAAAGLAEVRAAQGRLDEAVTLYQRSLDIDRAPPVLAAFGDLCAVQGDTATATALHDEAENAMAEEAKTAAVPHYRERARFLLDHDRHVELGLKLAQLDLQIRKDIYAQDTLAWALHKNGRHGEAAAAADQALRLGTQDATLFYHAGVIYHALGDAAKARTHLTQALAINPHFSPQAAQHARQLLEP